MEVRYYLRYFDVIGIAHYVTLDDPNFRGDGVQVAGFEELSYRDREDP